jgi:hypothetical protein
MEKSPGRGGAVTGGCFDQSKAPEAGCLLAVSVVPTAFGWAVGAAAVFPAGGGSAAKPFSAKAKVPMARERLKTDFTGERAIVVFRPPGLASQR